MKPRTCNGKNIPFNLLFYHDPLVYLTLWLGHVSMHDFVVSFLLDGDTFHDMIYKNIVNNTTHLSRKVFKYWEADKLTLWLQVFQISHVHLKIVSLKTHTIICFSLVWKLPSLVCIAKCPNGNYSYLSIVFQVEMILHEIMSYSSSRLNHSSAFTWCKLCTLVSSICTLCVLLISWHDISQRDVFQGPDVMKLIVTVW